LGFRHPGTVQVEFPVVVVAGSIVQIHREIPCDGDVTLAIVYRRIVNRVDIYAIFNSRIFYVSQLNCGRMAQRDEIISHVTVLLPTRPLLPGEAKYVEMRRN
jgi:hypothetical protein